ncbi:Flp pilus assembly protein CpaB [Pseudaminobacter sp. 19-2017]|uniref:Flp pilus assembly protein CpaB n=1 Tax=Pseudaminobacter soli (ex Zhang et al. 2022) TaxID=2831468 RepID=A0A942DWP0_9HYPH|nr:Flp pilus assembly protein CpaB [Pseudaminobacter soli]MBS3648097.1 Flp pilus assembly protein CpaB [Pseudaminobacter soli]
MRGSTLVSLGLSAVLALAAVVGVRSYLAQQKFALLQQGAAEAKPQHTIVVAARELRFGHPVRAEDLKLLPWPNEQLPTGGFATFEDIIGDGKEMRYIRSALEQDEPVLAAKVTGFGQRATLSTTLSEGMKAMSIRVNDVLGVAGFVLPGDRVDVMLTRTVPGDRDQEEAYVDVLLQGVKVLAVDQEADERKDQPSVVKTVTVEVSTEEAQQLTLASSVGTLSLALRNVGSAGLEETKPVRLADLGGGIAAEALKNEMSDEAKKRLGDLEKKLSDLLNRKPEPVAVEPPQPKFLVVGVTRNGGRQEYRFDQK